MRHEGGTLAHDDWQFSKLDQSQSSTYSHCTKYALESPFVALINYDAIQYSTSVQYSSLQNSRTLVRHSDYCRDSASFTYSRLHVNRLQSSSQGDPADQHPDTTVQYSAVQYNILSCCQLQYCICTAPVEYTCTSYTTVLYCSVQK